MEKMIPDLLREDPCPVNCPVCQANIDHNHSTGLTCINGHHFRKTGAGYINLLSNQVYHLYNKQSFKARTMLTGKGFFDQLERQLLALLYREYAINDSLTILDAGTGEGALFTNLLLCMRWDQFRHQGIGFDQFLPAVRTAAEQYPHALWLAADADQVPLRSGSVDVILNTLAPGNFEAFERILKPGGLLLKTVAGPAHLQELRGRRRQDTHGVEQTIQSFQKHIGPYKQLRLSFSKQVTEEERQLLLNMVQPAESIHWEQAMGDPLSSVTMDLIIVCGRKPYE